ncbi:MAG TPA: hypothetical protein VJ717_18565, partial [Gemmatimonadaceae bacterium]|nr:hypothetical protein [Gemmatimonadaceae bacterium]
RGQGRGTHRRTERDASLAFSVNFKPLGIAHERYTPRIPHDAGRQLGARPPSVFGVPGQGA